LNSCVRVLGLGCTGGSGTLRRGAQLAEGRGGLQNGAVAALGALPPDPYYVKPVYPAKGVPVVAAVDAPKKQSGMTK